MKLTFLILLIALVVFPSSGLAQNSNEATIGLYLVPEHDAPRMLCNEEGSDCEDPDLSVAGEIYTNYVVYVCVFNGDPINGVAAVEFAIDYDGGTGSGVDIFLDQTCSSLLFASSGWPNDGASAAYTWDFINNCQTNEPGGAGTGVTAVAAALTVFAYTPDRLSVVPKSSGVIDVVDCNNASFDVGPERRGSIVFSEDGTEAGNPGCSRATIEDATWGGVKKTYGDN